MRGGRGSALVQVLVMSILLIILVTGVLQVVFQNHVVLARIQRSDKYKAAADACMAQKYAEWAAGGACVAANPACIVNGLDVEVTCPGGRAEFTVVDPNW